MLVLLDNRDSFTFNLVQSLQELGADPLVLSARTCSPAQLRELGARHVLIGPGPGAPAAAGCSEAVWRELGAQCAILGVCLGMQALGSAYGARIRRAHELVHGWTSAIEHDGRGVFRGVPSPFAAGRYHSLAVDARELPACLEVSARSPDGEIMGLRHRELRSEGVQFHPESILSEHGRALLANFLAL